MFGRLRRTMSDARKIFVTVLILAIATIAAVGYVTVHTTRSQLVHRVDGELEREVHTAVVAVDVLSGPELQALARLDRVAGRRTAVIVLDRSGRIDFASPAGREPLPRLPVAAGSGVPLDHPFTVQARGSAPTYRAIARRLTTDRIIVMAAPLTTVDQTVRDLIRTMLLVATVATGILGLILWRVARAATKPMDAMIDVAIRIGNGDFTARIDPTSLRGDAGRLGAALNQMTARIQAAFAASAESEAQLRRFVADASHELRTPLTSIRGYAELCQAGASESETEVAVRRIQSEAVRMSELVEDLLLLARLDQGRPLECDPFDLGAAVRDITLDAQVIEPERPISIEVPDTPIIVTGDNHRIRQVLSNLLDNVRTHTDPHITVAVAAVAADSVVTVTVRDEGPGMTAADAARAFDPFFRPDDSRSRRSGGSGLGLAIAKAIVQAHGGSIELAAEAGRGTMIRFSLPRSASPVLTRTH